MSLVMTLPTEMLMHVASFMEVPELVNCATVCDQMKSVCCEYGHWQRFFVELKTRDCPEGRLCHSGVTYNGKMYVFGGHITQPASEFFHTVKQDMYEYNINTRQWRIVDAENGPKRTEHSSIVWNDTMVVFGGYSGAGYENTTHFFNFTTGLWAQVDAKGEVPSPRSAHTAVLIGNKMYIYGGWNGQSCMTDLYSLDLETQTWTAVRAEGIQPFARCSHGSVVAGENRDIMYIFGGYATEKSASPDKGYLNDLYEFNTRTSTWRSLRQYGELPCARSRFRLVTHDNHMYLFGGWNSASHFSSLFKMSLDTGYWTEISTDFDRDGLGQFSLVVEHDFMYIFSGFSPKIGGSKDNLYAYKLLSGQSSC